MALLGQKMDTLSQLMSEFIKEQKEIHAAIEKRFHDDEMAAQGRETRLTSAEEDIDSLKSKDTWGTIGAGVAAIIAGLIGWFK